MWNVDKDTAIISWDHHPSDLPLDPLNHLLMMFYNREPSIYAYVYEAYDEGNALGLIVTGSMEIPEGESGDQIFTAMFNKVHEEARMANHQGQYEIKEWDV